MNYDNNEFSIKGTLYNKEYTEIQGKKDPTAKYAKYILTLEVKKSREITEKDGKKRYISSTQLPQFEAFGINLDEFEINDFIEVRFYLSGKEYTKKNGDKAIMTKPMVTYVKFADLDEKGLRTSGKQPTAAMSNVNELPQRETVFVPPDPDEKDELSDLPF